MLLGLGACFRRNDSGAPQYRRQLITSQDSSQNSKCLFRGNKQIMWFGGYNGNSVCQVQLSIFLAYIKVLNPMFDPKDLKGNDFWHPLFLLTTKYCPKSRNIRDTFQVIVSEAESHLPYKKFKKAIKS